MGQLDRITQQPVPRTKLCWLCLGYDLGLISITLLPPKLTSHWLARSTSPLWELQCVLNHSNNVSCYFQGNWIEPMTSQAHAWWSVHTVPQGPADHGNLSNDSDSSESRNSQKNFRNLLVVQQLRLRFHCWGCGFNLWSELRSCVPLVPKFRRKKKFQSMFSRHHNRNNIPGPSLDLKSWQGQWYYPSLERWVCSQDRGVSAERQGGISGRKGLLADPLQARWSKDPMRNDLLGGGRSILEAAGYSMWPQRQHTWTLG